jgi:DNA-binding HxlR family transcriptional regulator
VQLAINILTSPPKMRIIELLRKPTTPDEIALNLKITRQAVDKHLKELLSYCVVEKRWFIGYNRPRVEFLLTDLGKELYGDISSLALKFRKDGLSTFSERIKSLDLEMISDRISVPEYKARKKELENAFKWFRS